MIHMLKTIPEFFQASAEGAKKFEVRKHDRPFNKGDYVALNEWSGGNYTGRCTLHKIVYILSDLEYCKEGYVILGLEPCTIRTWGEIQKPIPSNRRVPVYER
jgi:ParB family chromosome partitioning protein